MAQFDASGIDDLESWISSKDPIPDSVISGMLIAEGDVVADRQRAEAEAMLRGPYYRGGVKAGLVRKPPVLKGESSYLMITFEGTQHKERIGTIAFINEYGKLNQPPRPFVWEANKKAENDAVEAAASIFQKFMEE